ncbi:MAG: hypothetical protein AB7V77_01835 [Candidatus Woesearchaeota archaeon]
MNFDLITGLIFLIIFLISFETNLIVIKLISIISFLVSFIYLIKFIAEKFEQNKLLSSGLIIFLSLNTLLLWQFILNPIKHTLFFILFVIVLISIIFYLIHSYWFIVFNKNIKELKITSLILIFVIIFLICSYLYEHIIFYLFLIVSELIFIKANFDLTKRYVKK